MVPVSEGMILAVIQLSNSIAHPHRTFDAASDDFLAYFLGKNLFAQVRHDWAIDDWPVSENGSIARAGSIATKDWSVATHDRSISKGWRRGQLVGHRPISARWAIQELIQAIARYGRNGLHRAGQIGFSNNRPIGNCG